MFLAGQELLLQFLEFHPAFHPLLELRTGLLQFIQYGLSLFERLVVKIGCGRLLTEFRDTGFQFL